MQRLFSFLQAQTFLQEVQGRLQKVTQVPSSEFQWIHFPIVDFLFISFSMGIQSDMHVCVLCSPSKHKFKNYHWDSQGNLAKNLPGQSKYE